MDLRNCIGGLAQAAAAFVARLAGQTCGNVAMLFALSMPVLILMTLGGVDIHRASTVRLNLQDALDAAGLAAARSPYTDADNIQRIGVATLRANLQAYPDIMLMEDETTFTLTDERVVVADAKVNVKTLVANIFLPPYGKFMDDYLPVGAHSEVNRSSKNLEVSLVLDITASMNNGKINSLKTAAKDLIELVIQDQQSPFYSRVAVVPYSMGVNLGDYANAARGAAVGETSISNIAWYTGSAKSITNITRANPGVVTAQNHGFESGDFVWVQDVQGMTQINDRAYRVVRINSNTFSLEQWSSGQWRAVRTRSQDGYSSYSRSGDVRKCVLQDCSVVVTSNNHGLRNDRDDYVLITDVNGMTEVNNRAYPLTVLTTNTFSIGVVAPDWRSYSSQGKAWCGREGCEWRIYFNPAPYNQLRFLRNTTCVSERDGSQAYTDASPSSAKVGFNYAAAGNPCPAAKIQPLTDNKVGLKSMIDGMQIGGSTAGQIGAAWGWYSVLPTFNGLWPSNPAGAFDSNELLKAVVIMTDGEFNTPYCSGVIAANAGDGSGDFRDRINCNATNGNGFSQTLSLCSAMKAQGIVVYTVGFQVAKGGGAEDVIQRCATTPGHVYLPSSGADLTDAFKAIGRDITRLRISR